MGELAPSARAHNQGLEQPIDWVEEHTWELSKHLLMALLFLPMSMRYPGLILLREQVGALLSANREQLGADKLLVWVVG